MPPADVLSPNSTWGYWTANTAQTVWVNWTANVTVTASTTNVWEHWVDATGTAGPLIVSGHSVRQPTAEEIERRQAEARERQRKAEAAKERARAILLETLSDEQRAEFERDGHFHIETRDGQRRYRLRPGRPPIRVHGEDGRRWSYCIHPPGFGFPEDDVTLALKLLLEADEEAFLSTANRTPV